MKPWTDKQLMREFLAEFIGTFILVGVGDAAMAAYVLKNKDHQERNDSLAIAFCWGVGAMIGIAASAKVSGGHINPAVTVAQAVFKNFSWKKVPHYLAGQYLGGFVASLTIFILYWDALNEFDNGTRVAYGYPYSTGHIWATYPSPFLSIFGALFDQVIGTGILVFAVLAITDTNGLNVPIHLQPIFLCVTITVMCTAFAANCMAVLNPARDLPPRIFTLIAGWGLKSFAPLSGHYWWVGGIVGPHIGAIIGAGVYYLTIGVNKFSNTRDYSSTQHGKEEIEVIATDDANKSKEQNI